MIIKAFSIMKKLVWFAFIFFNLHAIFAQIPPPLPVIDSSKANNNKPVPAKHTDSLSTMLPSNDIIDNLSKAQTLSKFFNAIQVAGLTETFKSKGPVTLFVPDNQAFEKMSAGKLDTLFRPGHAPELVALITYHAIAGRLTSRDIERQINSNHNLGTFTTITGSKLTATIDTNRNIVLIDENGRRSMIKRFDIPQSNGILFVIDSVLIPKKKLL
ncbi:MAG: Cell surface lipoprotein precursor [Mucilaginibacter sp.]|nr:Cell surface lipoprotein precursor [Mucilaginibacter sp.]MDB5109383.1 Cell surface lipoprotein precursor [Mucilaginibacter sp.]